MTPAALVSAVVKRARAAQEFYSRQPQETVDRACLAVGWAALNPVRNRRLSEMAVAETGLGNVADKERKNHRKTLGLLRDIRGQKTVGVIAEYPGMVEIARPAGVVGALTPSTNPVATPVNKTINALKGGNAIILAPPPSAAKTGELLLTFIHEELGKCGLSPDLVQMLTPPSKAATQALCERADLLAATGSRRNVRVAAGSGTPSLGVGVGNVAVIVDETAAIDAAAEKIAASKIFDNATSCSSENHLIIIDVVYDAMLRALEKYGGHLLDDGNKRRLARCLWTGDGALNRELIAKECGEMARLAELDDIPAAAKFLLAEENQTGAQYPFSGEKLSPVLTVYRAADFAAAKMRAAELLRFQGAGHSVGIHTQDDRRPLMLGLELPVCRVIVNQSHCFANGGAFDNALPFSLSMGCGTWGGNTIGENLNFRHFINITRVVTRIPPQEPSVEEIFADYWAAGKA